VTQELCDVCAVSYREVGRAVRSLGTQTKVLSLEPHSITDILSTVIEAGRHSDHRAMGENVVAELRFRLDGVRALPKLANPPRVVCVEWTDPLMAGGHWVPEMVDLAGGVDVLGVAHEPSRWVSADEIRHAAPNIIILMPCGFHLADTVRIGEELKHEGKAEWFGDATVVAVDSSSYFNRPGPRIVDGVELVANILRGGIDESRGKATWLTPIPAAL
jgi:iron complex transport system substrate-binding protein